MKQRIPLTLALASVLAAVGCANVAQRAGDVQAEIAAVCQEAAPLAGVDPAIGIYVTAACATEEAIAKVALSPSGLHWIEKLYAELLMAKNELARKPAAP